MVALICCAEMHSNGALTGTCRRALVGAGRSRLASKVFTITESWDVAAFLGRQFGMRWRWMSGLAVPHLMNKVRSSAINCP